MRKRHKVHQALLKKTKAKKKGWFAKYRIHILSILGLFALFFGVLSYYQQSNSVLGLAIFDGGGSAGSSGGSSNGSSKSVSTRCNKVRPYCDKYGGHITYSQCYRTVKYSNSSKTTTSGIRDYTIGTNIKGCKPSYEIKLSPTPTPGITLTISKSSTCNTDNSLDTNIYWKTNYNSAGDQWSCRYCYFQSGESRMSDYEHNKSIVNVYEYRVWERDIMDITAPAQQNIRPDYKDFLNNISKTEQDNPIGEFISTDGTVGAPSPVPINLGKNSYEAEDFIYTNLFKDDYGNGSNSTIAGGYLSLSSISTADKLEMPADQDFRNLRFRKIYIVDTTKHVVSNGVNMSSYSCTN